MQCSYKKEYFNTKYNKDDTQSIYVVIPRSPN